MSVSFDSKKNERRERRRGKSLIALGAIAWEEQYVDFIASAIHFVLPTVVICSSGLVFPSCEPGILWIGGIASVGLFARL